MKQASMAVLMIFFIGFALTSQTKDDDNSSNDPTSKISLQELIESKTNDYTITHEHVSSISQVRNVYIRQAINGIGIYGTESSIHIRPSGTIVAEHNTFLTDVNNRLKNNSVSIMASEAIQQVAMQKGYGSPRLQMIEAVKGSNQAALFNDGGISLRPIPVQLMYYYQEEQGIRLCWKLSIAEVDGTDWFSFIVDASNGKILKETNWMVECGQEHEHEHDNSSLNYNTNFNDISSYKDEASINNPVASGAQYEVFAMPLESPYYGNRTIVTDPATSNASPFGWHDTNGVAGAEFNTTQGNNVNAFEADDKSGYQPDGGTDLHFIGYTFDQDYSNDNQYEDAAITNLFYWNNIIHDILYEYGFDEAAGNFQENNYGKGGTGGDSVNARAQDGSGTCNARFGTPDDGDNPTMRMYLCVDKDGDFDNLVIAHEYGHGISNRLTGGGGNTECLDNDEQMGEGWSDFYGYILTINAGETGTDARGVGTYLFDHGAGGAGIRAFMYSTDMTVNPHTYDDIIGTGTSEHALGTVWATMLWDLTWNLIDAHGFDTNFYNFTGDATQDAGNIQALALVTEAMKIQPCSPGFVDGRDAIIAADLAIYGGANECLIWSTFARRGLGLSADQGSTDSRTDGTEAFDTPNPPVAVCVAPFEITLDTNGEVHLDAEDDIDDGSFDSCGIAEYSLSQAIFTCADVGPQEVTLTVTDTDGNEDTCTTTITILKRPVTLTYTGDLSEQYSDQADLSATLTDTDNGDPLSGHTVTFTIGTQSVDAVTDINGEASTTLILTQDPNVPYTVETTVAEEACYLAGSDSDVFDILQEDAIVEYTGHTFQATPSENDNEALVVLTANIQDITPGDPGSDPFPGDIRNAMVKFVDRDAVSDISGWIPVTDLFDPSDPTTGSVSYNWLVNLGNSDSESYTVGILVGSLDANGYYLHNSSDDNTIINVYKPAGDFITGGGTIHPDNSAGQYASTNGLKLNFGYNVKYNNGGKKLIGHCNVIFRVLQGDGVHTYQIKGNAIQSLGVNIFDPNNKLAEFATKATLKDITDPLNPISFGGNLRLHIDMTDRGEPGGDDSISFNLTTANGVLLYSSDWNGIETLEMNLSGGNIVIHNGFSKSTLLGVFSEDSLMGGLMFYPNPTSDIIYMVQTDTNAYNSLGIYDLTGRLVRNIDVTNAAQKMAIDISDLASSTYIFVVKGASGQIVKRVIKE